MRKLYFVFALLLIFVVAMVTDWNIRQESSERGSATSLIQSRNDDILELEIGYPAGKGPPARTLIGGERKNQPQPRRQPVVPAGPRTVINHDEPDPEWARREAGDLSSREGYYWYTVKSGDTLSEIALRFLGTSRRADEIMKLNGIEDPRKVQAGMELKIPRE